jgi:chorismate mutase
MADLNIHPLESWGFHIKGKLIIAGPCSAESEKQVMETAMGLAGGPVHLLRAGIWKPRTHPDSFAGVGAKGLKWIKKAGRAAGLPVTVEAACPEHVRQCLDHGIDAIWIGARTTVNPFAVQAIADSLRGVDIPVLVKNPVNPDVELWIGALERLSRAGLLKLAAIHRGFSSFKKNEYRNRPHWEMVIELRRKIPQLPVLCDPSHICGNRTLLPEVSQTAMDLLMDGLMIECHIDPDKALSDAGQQLRPDRLRALLNALELKRESAANPGFHLQIDKTRRKIDDIDFRLMELLGERMEISRMIGREKKKNKISILQPIRWKHIVESRTEAGEKMNLSRAFTFDLFQKIHRESIRNQRLGEK